MDAVLPKIEAALREATGGTFRITETAAVGGGSIHRTLTVGDGQQRYFVKTGAAQARTMFEGEADGLAAIAATGAFRTPAVIALGGDAEHAFLILEHLEMHTPRSPEEGEAFASALVRLHQNIGPAFGWERDNHIGATPQHNPRSDNWAGFFATQRLRPQLERARQGGHGGELQQFGARVLERLPALFLEYRPRPSLLHGDLWHGNAGITAQGEPVLFDPACYHGDRESDLAMSELFGGFPGAFYATYRREWPLDPGYEARKPLYNLYHLLNHLNLFGAGYLREATRLAAQLAR
ncbi:MAG: fructosamine kinase family protein [Rhodocyclales bacterium]|nr:fructosamine kinase family protein [Rhodocyclales bacterium]